MGFGSGERQSRRGVLKGMLAAGVTAVSGGCLSIAGVREFEPFGFRARSDRVRRSDATHVVDTVSDLRAAVSTPGSVVWVPGDVELRLDSESIPIEANVTLASSRGIDGHGARLTVSSYRSPVFQSSAPGIRVSGLRVIGPETGYFDPRQKPKQASAYYSRAFEFTGDGIEIDHCELAGWTHTAVSLGSRDSPTGSRIHHNAIHHNQMDTLGYGVELRNGPHLIEWNYFDHNRHSVAAFGHRENGYEARFNVVGPHAVRHAFDMHGLGENIDGYSGSLAGKYLRVHHTVFESTDAAAVVLRGESTNQSWVRNNWCGSVPFLEPRGRQSVILQSRVDSPARFRVENNQYGERAVRRGRSWLKEHASEHDTTVVDDPTAV